MDDKANAGSTADTSDRARLVHLAQLLDCKPEDFVSPAGGPTDLTALAELLRLWLAIEKPDGHEKLLVLARQLARPRT